jgi:thymidylate synthase
MNKNIYKNATSAFEYLFHYISNNGEIFDKTKALFDVSFTIENPSDKIITNPKRKFNTEYAEFEWNWYLSGNRDASEIAKKAKIWNDMMIPNTTEVNSNYGYFWNKDNQLSKAIEELSKNKNSRRAVIIQYDINELDRYKYDTPCNIALNFYCKNDKLYLSIFARSIDLVFGFCNDQYQFAKLMELVSSELNMELGTMNFFITNLHIYPRHFDLL